MDSFNLNMKLIEKAKGEYGEFIFECNELLPGEIIRRADEISAKNQIVKYLENHADEIPLKIRKYLLEDDVYILDSCYQNVINDEDFFKNYESAIYDGFAELVFISVGNKIVIDKTITEKEAFPEIEGKYIYENEKFDSLDGAIDSLKNHIKSMSPAELINLVELNNADNRMSIPKIYFRNKNAFITIWKLNEETLLYQYPKHKIPIREECFNEVKHECVTCLSKLHFYGKEKEKSIAQEEELEV